MKISSGTTSLSAEVETSIYGTLLISNSPVVCASVLGAIIKKVKVKKKIASAIFMILFIWCKFFLK
ncbi:MAG TPA: hypothetical protein DCQ93_04345 [Bacteroidetes bacterium]|nr:hypothetical protein [Bacteroidota bacterium]